MFVLRIFRLRCAASLVGLLLFVPLTESSSRCARAASPSAGEVERALARATRHMRTTIADHGGYAWVSSADGAFSHGEGIAGADRVWVQPPGTPAVGLAFLRAYRATGDPVHLDAARACGQTLIRGQLRSGGWGYAVEFDPAARREIPYRVGPRGGREHIVETPAPGGWAMWRQRAYPDNRTLLDDDTTPAAIRFLVRLDQALESEHAGVHEAAEYALKSTLGAQYPIGAWSHNYDRFPQQRPAESYYRVLRATLPEAWSRTWTKDFDGCYMLNDRITPNIIATMLLAWQVYGEERYRDSALRGGEFLLRAQLPEPQPAWAQQYDRQMHPVWDRSFEPPAVTAGESQDVLETLLRLHEATGEERFLEPIPKALDYLKSCLRDDGQLARFYELKTNRPLYFDDEYQLTYDDREVPDHYGFVVASRLEEIEQRYRRAVSEQDKQPKASSRSDLAEQAAAVIAQQADSGAWLDPGFVRDAEGKKVTPEQGVVHSETFIENVETLCGYLEQRR